MKIRILPKPELLRRLIDYNPSTGALIWKTRPAEMFAHNGDSADWRCRSWNTKNAGKPAFNHRHGKRHLAGTLLGEVHLAHRVAWAIHFGVREFGTIDHRDGDGFNNQISNLRLVNRAINSQNARRRRDCSSGVTGVHWHVGRYGMPRWVARIQCGNRRHFLGSFDHVEDAIAARREAEIQFDFGPVHGRDAPNG